MLSTDQLSQIFTTVCSEIEIELMLERRGMNLGDNLAKLYSLREQLKKEITEAAAEAAKQ